MDSAAIKKRYQDLQNQYTTRVSGQQDFQNELEKIYGERTNYNKDLIDQKNQLQSQIYAKPSAERANLAGSALLDPLRQEALIRGDVANLQGSLGSSVDLLNARGQKWSDILAKAMGGYNAKNEGLRLSAASAWQEYQDQLAQEEAARSRAAAAAQQQAYINAMLNQRKGEDTVPTKPNGGIVQTEKQTGGLNLGNSILAKGGKDPVTQWVDKNITNTVGRAAAEYNNLPWYQKAVLGSVLGGPVGAMTALNTGAADWLNPLNLFKKK